MEDYLLQTRGLTKQYGAHRAVDQVSLHLKKGDIYGFIGRNGAGKTTFLKMISGLARPTSGEIELFGKVGNGVRSVYSRIGVLIEAPGLYPNMNAAENMKLMSLCSGIGDKKYLEDILELVGLSEAGKKKVKNFSLGMKQRLGIGIALVGEPDLLVLDEPINGLDPQGIVEMRGILQRLNKERDITILISSHILDELSKIATRYGIIHNGQLIQELGREELSAKSSERIEIKTPETDHACTVLEEDLGIRKYKVMDASTIHIYEHLEDTPAINTALVKKGVNISSIQVCGGDLESYFMEITGGAQHA